MKAGFFCFVLFFFSVLKCTHLVLFPIHVNWKDPLVLFCEFTNDLPWWCRKLWIMLWSGGVWTKILKSINNIRIFKKYIFNNSTRDTNLCTQSIWHYYKCVFSGDILFAANNRVLSGDNWMSVAKSFDK